jgi:hypothetical protein
MPFKLRTMPFFSYEFALSLLSTDEEEEELMLLSY